MITGYERPITTHSLRPARESCEACHWPEARHDDTIRIKVPLRDRSEEHRERTTLQMHTGEPRRGGDAPQLRPEARSPRASTGTSRRMSNTSR